MSTNYQQRFWRELDQLRIHASYAEYYYEHTVQTDRIINMALAVVASGGVAGWAVWNKYQQTWAVIVAGSQVVNAVKGYLPYSKRLKALGSLASELESLFITMEGHWFNVSEGLLTDEEIHKLHMKIKDQRRLLIQKCVGTVDIPHNQRLMDKAVTAAKCYFENFYLSEEQER